MPKSPRSLIPAPAPHLPKDTAGYIIAPATDHEMLGEFTKDIHKNAAAAPRNIPARA